MRLTRVAFFRSLFLAPAAAIAAADRPIAEKLAKAEKLKPAAVYAMYPEIRPSLRDASYLQSVWADAWKRKGIDPPSLLICDPGMRIEALPGRVALSEEDVSYLLSRGLMTANEAHRFSVLKLYALAERP